MSKSIILPDEIILSKIFQLRGQKVMLDRDLAEIFRVETRRLNEQVKRNIERFPENFMFKLTEQEVELMVSQNAIPSKQILGGSLPNVFTEHGVLMLANVLKSEKAIRVSLKIIEIFVKLRAAIASDKNVLLKLAQLDNKISSLGFDVKMLDGEIETIFELINEIREERKRVKKITVVEGFAKKKLK